MKRKARKPRNLIALRIAGAWRAKTVIAGYLDAKKCRQAARWLEKAAEYLESREKG
jgi:hypothetical protein